MSLYYLKGSESQHSSGYERVSAGEQQRMGIEGWLLLILASLFIMSAAILQGVDRGLLWNWERQLIGSLPAGWQPASPKMVLLTMGEESGGFNSLDLAMALRGLGKFHPAHILIHGRIAPVSIKEPLPLLQGVLARSVEEGMEIIIPQSPTPESIWKFLPICSYQPPALFGPQVQWPILPGHVTPSGKDSFLPNDKAPSALTLLALADDGAMCGSLWWHAITSFIPRSVAGPTWLLGSRLLIFPNHSTLLLNEEGAVTGESLLSPIDCKVVPLADFLLKLEQKERGTLSPNFETLWENATVIIGPPTDLSRVSLLASLQTRLALRSLPLVVQTALLILWISLHVLGTRFSTRVRLVTAVTLLVLCTGLPILALSKGWLLPYLPPLLTALLLLVPQIVPLRK